MSLLQNLFIWGVENWPLLKDGVKEFYPSVASALGVWAWFQNFQDRRLAPHREQIASLVKKCRAFHEVHQIDTLDYLEAELEPKSYQRILRDQNVYLEYLRGLVAKVGNIDGGLAAATHTLYLKIGEYVLPRAQSVLIVTPQPEFQFPTKDEVAAVSQLFIDVDTALEKLESLCAQKKLCFKPRKKAES